ncbi:MAG: hypothetical protein ACTSWN_03940 [Promethearchaeota archaeon]
MLAWIVGTYRAKFDSAGYLVALKLSPRGRMTKAREGFFFSTLI